MSSFLLIFEIFPNGKLQEKSLMYIDHGNIVLIRLSA